MNSCSRQRPGPATAARGNASFLGAHPCLHIQKLLQKHHTKFANRTKKAYHLAAAEDCPPWEEWGEHEDYKQRSFGGGLGGGSRGGAMPPPPAASAASEDGDLIPRWCVICGEMGRHRGGAVKDMHREHAKGVRGTGERDGGGYGAGR
jgi:hypothetical protein